MARHGREEFAYGSLLEATTKGLYPDKRHVLREFVQNSFDAIRDLPSALNVRPIEVRLEPPSIIIYDEGIGMSAKQMRQYRYAGYSEKDRKERVGFRGIGKLSGIAVAKQILVTSSRRGEAKRYRVAIEAEKMFDDLSARPNTPLNQLLRSRSKVDEFGEKSDAHYTLVELREIRPDSQSLFNVADIAHYLSKNVPVPLDPAFAHAAAVNRALMQQVPDYFECPLILNGEPVYKAYPRNINAPQFVPVFFGEDDSHLIAYVWYCQNSEGGQFKEMDARGLVYRAKNFAVGDEWRPRQNLWPAGTQNRAFHFFGEIHVCDLDMVPTADRTDFEDNKARQRLYERFKPVCQRLNREAERESAQRRLNVTLSDTESLVARRMQEAESGTLGVEVKPQVEFEVRKRLEDLDKRLKRAGGRKSKDLNKSLIRRGRLLAKRARRLLTSLDNKDKTLYDVTKSVPMSAQAQEVYRIAVAVLQDELRANPALLEKIILALRHKIEEKFS